MVPLNNIPFFQEMDHSTNILIAGIGGGFDIYAGLPLYFNLLNQRKKVILANYSFTQLSKTDAREIYPFCYKIEPSTKEKTKEYFPEKYLAEWLSQQKIEATIYAFGGTGPKTLQKSYQQLCDQFSIDTIIGIDGGTDGLMFGDEEDLGTPLQDYISLAAMYQVTGPKKYLANVGFGIDEISHFRFLENVATLIKNNGYLGTISLHKEMEEVQKYISAVAYANSCMPNKTSIINNAILCAIEGFFGREDLALRTRAKNISVNTLMNMYWFFHLDKIIEQTYYYNLIKDEKDQDEVTNIIRTKLPLVSKMRKTEKMSIF